MAIRLKVDIERCSGCRACQVACVFAHEEAFGVRSARLHVEKRDILGLDRPRVCLDCDPAPCVEACAAGALVRDAGGSLQLNERTCDLCGACFAACPEAVLRPHPETGRPLVCDLCGGRPACVAACVTGALRVEERGP